MVVFDLLPTAATNDSMPGVMKMSFGSPSQEVNVLVAFYTNSEAAVHVPAGALCSTSDNSADKAWNSIQEPSAGDFVSTSNGSDSLAGLKLVEWIPSSDSKTLNITLRKGRGGDAENVTVIESGFSDFFVLDIFYFLFLFLFLLIRDIFDFQRILSIMANIHGMQGQHSCSRILQPLQITPLCCGLKTHLDSQYLDTSHSAPPAIPVQTMKQLTILTNQTVV